MGMLKIILASTGARPAEIKRLLFLHFYSTDFGAEERTQIASALARRGRPDGRGKLSMNRGRSYAKP